MKIQLPLIGGLLATVLANSSSALGAPDQAIDGENPPATTASNTEEASDEAPAVEAGASESEEPKQRESEDGDAIAPSPSSPADPDDVSPSSEPESEVESGEGTSSEGSKRDEPSDIEAPHDAAREADEELPADEEHQETQPSDDPYADLDHTGTPKPPAKESKDPDGKWKEDYDGRANETPAEDILIWIPRAPLYPAHLVLNYGVRWPIVAGVTLAEEAKLFARIEDFFTFADGRAGLYPTAFYDRGRGFWGGANFFFNDLGVKGHSFRATAGIGTNEWYHLGINDTWEVFENERGELSFQVEISKDPTYNFTGLGPETDIDDTVYYAEEKKEALVDLRVALSGLNRFTSTLGFRQAEMHGGRAPSILDEDSPVDASGLTGFDQTFYLGSVQMKLDLDSRNPENEWLPGSGVRLETWGGYHYGPGSIEMSFFRYGLEPSLNLDLSGAGHMLSFSAHAEALTKTRAEAPPINELVILGGNERLRGFLPGRFTGESSLVYSIDYSFPLLAYADLMLFAEAGNAFLGFFEGFAHDELVLDWGTGLRTSFSREMKLFLGVGFGTNQIEDYDEFAVESTRVFAGVTRDL